MAFGDAVAGLPRGLGLLMARGMPAWIGAWRTLTPALAPPGAAPAPTSPSDVISVLASMALACVGSA